MKGMIRPKFTWGRLNEQTIAAVPPSCAAQPQKHPRLGVRRDVGLLNAEEGANSNCMVCAQNDDMVIGAVQAIKAAGVAPA